MLKFIFALLLFLPILLFCQSKKKKIKIAIAKEKQEHICLVNKLKQHIQFLAADSLEGRRAGTKGEKLAIEYLINNYKLIGLEPANNENYTQEFEYNEGKSFLTTKTYFKIDNILLKVDEDFFPLAFSHQNSFKSNATIALRESGETWFIDIKDIVEENKANPHFDIETYIKTETKKAALNGANALIIFNTSNSVDNIVFNKRDTAESLPIPVIYIQPQAQKKYFNDILASHKLDVSIDIIEVKRKISNVVGYINNNVENTIILGAHYDHLGYGEDKNALDTINDIHNGADDNASGCAALLELASLLKQSSCKNNNYLFINFSGEELGLLGSKYWLENPTVKVIPNYMINMDMIGRYDTTHKLLIGGFGTSPTWADVLPKTNDLLFKYDSIGSGPSDHASFYRKEIPVLFFFTGSHTDYHKTTDDFEKINYDAEANIVKYILATVLKANDKGKLKFTKTAEPVTGKNNRFTVSLGFIPDYGFTGNGVRVDGISVGKLAAKIGLQIGDIITQLGEYKCIDIMSYMQTLGKFKKGDATILYVTRKNETKEFEIAF